MLFGWVSTVRQRHKAAHSARLQLRKYCKPSQRQLEHLRLFTACHFIPSPSLTNLQQNADSRPHSLPTIRRSFLFFPVPSLTAVCFMGGSQRTTMVQVNYFNTFNTPPKSSRPPPPHPPTHLSFGGGFLDFVCSPPPPHLHPRVVVVNEAEHV